MPVITPQEVMSFWKTIGGILGFLSFGGCITLLGILIKMIESLLFKFLDWRKVRSRGAVRLVSVFLLIFLLFAGAISYTLLTIRLGGAEEPHVHPPISINVTRQVQIVGVYDFKQGTEGWGISEGKDKSAMVSVSKQVMHSGMPSLEVMSHILGDENAAYASKYERKSAYLHTQATVWFDRIKPIGSPIYGPYDLTGQEISCWVLVPRALATGDAYIQIFIKDERFANQYAPAMSIDSSKVGIWIQLSLLVGDSINNVDPNFSSKEVDALGIQLVTLPGSKLDYTGPFYISDCIV